MSRKHQGSRKVKSLSERIAEAQAPFLRRAMDLGYSPLCRKYEEENYAFLPFFVCTRLPRNLVAMAGGCRAVIADLGLDYVRGVRNWFISKRKAKLSTFVGNALRWGLFDLVREAKLIVSLSENQIEKRIAADELRPTTPVRGSNKLRLIPFARQAARPIRYFHGREGRVSDSSLLVDHDPAQMCINREEQLDIRRFYRRVLLCLTDRRRDVLLLRMGFHAKRHSCAETARRLGVTVSRISQLEQDARQAIYEYADRTESDFLSRMDLTFTENV